MFAGAVIKSLVFFHVHDGLVGGWLGRMTDERMMLAMATEIYLVCVARFIVVVSVSLNMFIASENCVRV